MATATVTGPDATPPGPSLAAAAAEVWDIAGVADFLRVPAEHVRQLATTGRLPGQ